MASAFNKMLNKGPFVSAGMLDTPLCTCWLSSITLDAQTGADILMNANILPSVIGDDSTDSTDSAS